MKLWALFSAVSIAVSSYGSLLPEYDKNCDSLNTSKCPAEQLMEDPRSPSFRQEVPRMLHRIWFGNQAALSQENRKSWESYAYEFGYAYHLWTEADRVYIKEFMEPRNYHLWESLIANGNWWAASDLLRYELMKTFGGIYLDCDMGIPIYKGKRIDFFSFISDRGITFMTEHVGRNIGSHSSCFTANGFMASPPNHPIMLQAVSQICANCVSWLKTHDSINAMYCTGPFFINRIINGTYSVVPVTFMKELGMN